MATSKVREFRISFEGASVAESGILACDLRDAVLDSDPEVTAKKLRSDDTALNFGDELSVVLGTRAIIAVAEGIKKWLQLHKSASLCIKRPDGTIVVKNLTGKQAVDLAKHLSGAGVHQTY